MATIVKCSECGATLRKWPELPEPVRALCNDTYYDRLYRDLYGRCSHCNHKLPAPSSFAEGMTVQVSIRNAEDPTVEDCYTPQRLTAEAKKREYSQRPDVKAKKREYSQRWWKARQLQISLNAELPKILEAS